MARIVAAGIRCSRMPTTTRCLPCSRHLWKPLRPLRMTCPQSPISPRTRTSQNRLLQRSLHHSPQNLLLAMAVLRPKPTRRKAHNLRQQNPQAKQQLYARPASSIPGSFTPRPVGSSVGIGAAKPSFGLNSQSAAQPKPPVKVDVSKIKVGVKVKHKAFGVGTVAAIQPDMVTVRFGSVEKKFLLPAAIVQGYLMLI
mgnify:CR=1 FL=1